MGIPRTFDDGKESMKRRNKINQYRYTCGQSKRMWHFHYVERQEKVALDGHSSRHYRLFILKKIKTILKRKMWFSMRTSPMVHHTFDGKINIAISIFLYRGCANISLVHLDPSLLLISCVIILRIPLPPPPPVKISKFFFF